MTNILGAVSSNKAILDAMRVVAMNLGLKHVSAGRTQETIFTALAPTSQDVLGTPADATGTQIKPSQVSHAGGVRLVATPRNLSKGDFVKTDNQYDLMIQEKEAKSFVAIQSAGGQTVYTDALRLTVNDQGQLTTFNGHVLQDEITLPDNTLAFTVARNGDVMAQVSGQADAQNIGRIRLYSFRNPNGLEYVGDGLFMDTLSSGPALDAPEESTLIQGGYEASNVQTMQELMNLRVLSQSFEALNEAIKSWFSSNQLIVGVLRG